MKLSQRPEVALKKKERKSALQGPVFAGSSQISGGGLGEGCVVWDVGVQNFVVDNFVYNCLVTSNLLVQIDCLNPPYVYACLCWVCK